MEAALYDLITLLPFNRQQQHAHAVGAGQVPKQ
jgi:hypothetical protein